MFEPGDQKMPIPLLSVGDITLANTGNCTIRFNGSSLGGALTGGVPRKWQKPGPELTEVKPARVHPLSRTSPQRMPLANAAPPRRQRRDFRRGVSR
jgi:hypothetical protein